MSSEAGGGGWWLLELQCLQDGAELETETQTLLTASVCCSEHYRLLSHTPLHPRLTIVRVILLVRVNITSDTEPGPDITADSHRHSGRLAASAVGELVWAKCKVGSRATARGGVEGGGGWQGWQGGNNGEFHPSTIDPV